MDGKPQNKKSEGCAVQRHFISAVSINCANLGGGADFRMDTLVLVTNASTAEAR